MTKDMTEGNPSKLMFFFMVPLFFNMLANQVYTISDAAILGRGAGIDALAAVGVTGTMSWVLFAIVFGIANGVGIIVSQYFGAKDESQIKKAFAMGIIVQFFVTVIIIILCLLITRPLMEILGTPSNIIENAYLYIHTIILGLLFNGFSFFLPSCIRALGNSFTPFMIMLVGTVLNIVLDALFIFVFHWGVAGAALATVLSQLISVILSIFAIRKFPLLRLSKEDWKIDTKMIKKVLKIGLPIGLLNSVTALGGLIIQKTINSFGSETIAGYSIGWRLVSIILNQVGLIEPAVSIFVGQNYGAKNFDRIKKGARTGLLLGFLIALVSCIPLCIFGKSLVPLFYISSSDVVISSAYQFLFINSIGMPLLVILFVYRSALQGIGDTKTGLYSGFIEVIARIATVSLLPAILGFAKVGLSEVAAWFFSSILLVTVYVIKIKKFGKGGIQEALMS